MKTILSAFIGLILLVLLLGFICKSPSALAQRSEEVKKESNERPLTIAAAYRRIGSGRFRHTWYVSINSAGKGEIINWPDGIGKGDFKKTSFQVTPGQFAALRKTVDNERFLHIKEKRLGFWTFDGGHCRSLTIVRGERAKTVEIGMLGKQKNEKNKLEIERALTVWELVRGWVADEVPPKDFELKY